MEREGGSVSSRAPRLRTLVSDAPCIRTTVGAARLCPEETRQSEAFRVHAVPGDARPSASTDVGTGIATASANVNEVADTSAATTATVGAACDRRRRSISHEGVDVASVDRPQSHTLARLESSAGAPAAAIVDASHILGTAGGNGQVAVRASALCSRHRVSDLPGHGPATRGGGGNDQGSDQESISGDLPQGSDESISGDLPQQGSDEEPVWYDASNALFARRLSQQEEDEVRQEAADSALAQRLLEQDGADEAADSALARRLQEEEERELIWTPPNEAQIGMPPVIHHTPLSSPRPQRSVQSNGSPAHLPRWTLARAQQDVVEIARTPPARLPRRSVAGSYVQQEFVMPTVAGISQTPPGRPPRRSLAGGYVQQESAEITQTAPARPPLATVVPWHDIEPSATPPRRSLARGYVQQEPAEINQTPPARTPAAMVVTWRDTEPAATPPQTPPDRPPVEANSAWPETGPPSRRPRRSLASGSMRAGVQVTRRSVGSSSPATGESPSQMTGGACVVCLDALAVATFVHGDTGHTACCLPCARDLERRDSRCPVCRRAFSMVIRNFGA